MDGLGADERGIDVTVNFDSAPIKLDRAIPFALVVNELLSNALKHAFPDGRRGVVSLRVKRDADDGVVLTVRDNGVGLGEARDRAAWSGGKILRALVGQLGAEMDVRSSGGTMVTVRVPDLKGKSRR